MRNIVIEISNSSYTLRDANSGNYIKSFIKKTTALKKADELAKGGKITLINK